MDFKDCKIECDICHSRFTVTSDTLTEKKVTLNKEGEEYAVTLTILCCPICGKTYPVLVDDAESEKIVQDLRECLVRRMKYARRHKGIPQKLQNKLNRISKKLDFKRKSLAGKVNGALYQFEGATVQLDYQYHA